MTEYKTEFGSLANYSKGGVQLINDDPKNYVFSNIFEVASKAAPFERVCVAKNMEYVVEIMRVEGASPWFAAPHDEFALIMDGNVRVELNKLADGAPESGQDGAVLLEGEPAGQKMGHVNCGRGHMAMLPVGAAYRFVADAPSVVLIQTIDGPVSIHRWAEICQTE